MNPDPTSLDNLHDLIVPPSAPWWPPTLGWWLVILGLAVVLVGLLLKALFRWQANRYRREALALLHSDQMKPAMIPTLLKRVALTTWPREQTASLNGEEWLAFLDRSGGMDVFRNGPGAVLEKISYDTNCTADPTELKRLAGAWIKTHRRDFAP